MAARKTVATIIAALRRPVLSLLLATVFLNLCSVSALSVSTPSIGRRRINHDIFTPRTSILFPSPSTANATRRSPAFTTVSLAATNRLGTPGRIVGSPKKLAFEALSKISRNIARLRRSVLRAAVVLSLVLFSARSVTPPAHAWGSKGSATVSEVSADPPAKSSASAKCVKLFVTAGAVAAGAATARKIRTFGDDKSEGDDLSSPKTNVQAGGVDQDGVIDVVPKDKPSPLPLPVKEQQSNDAEKEKKTMPKRTPASNAKKETPAEAMVKDLDSKIEMLRAREELARADAERKRLDDMEKAAEARKRDQAKLDARTAAADAAERERTERIQRDRAERELREREGRLAELEQGKKEQLRLEEQAKKVLQQSEDDGTKDVSEGKDVDVEMVRQQPKPAEEEQKLKEKYGNMDLEERAFNILVDLGMVDLHSDPDSSLDWDENDDNAFM